MRLTPVSILQSFFFRRPNLLLQPILLLSRQLIEPQSAYSTLQVHARIVRVHRIVLLICDLQERRVKKDKPIRGILLYKVERRLARSHDRDRPAVQRCAVVVRQPVSLA